MFSTLCFLNKLLFFPRDQLIVYLARVRSDWLMHLSWLDHIHEKEVHDYPYFDNIRENTNRKTSKAIKWFYHTIQMSELRIDLLLEIH